MWCIKELLNLPQKYFSVLSIYFYKLLWKNVLKDTLTFNNISLYTPHWPCPTTWHSNVPGPGPDPPILLDIQQLQHFRIVLLGISIFQTEYSDLKCILTHPSFVYLTMISHFLYFNFLINCIITDCVMCVIMTDMWCINKYRENTNNLTFTWSLWDGGCGSGAR